MFWRSPAPEILEPKNRGGSVEHYYHFVYGALVPLAEFFSAKDFKKRLRFTRSCGPLTRHIVELKFDNLVVVEKSAIPRLKQDYRSIELPGYDGGRFYHTISLARTRDFMLERLNLENSKPTPKVVIIDRGTSDPFYQSREADIPTSANLRRSTPNMHEMVAAMRDLGTDAELFKTESMTLSEQARLFRNADMVIGQHGASLTNALWMRPGSKVIEITSRQFDKSFYNQRTLLGLPYLLVPQASDHAPVDIPAVLQAVKQLNA